MIRAILFDYDQTLVDFPATDRDAAKRFRDGASRCYAYLSAHDLSLPAFESFHRQQRRIHRRTDFLTWITGGEPDMRRPLRRLCSDYKLQRDQVSLAKLAWLWYEPHAEQATVAAGVTSTLATLSEAGIELGLVANSCWQGEVIDRHLEDLGLLEYLPARIYSTDIGARKPDVRMFEAALQQLGVSAAETVFVGDDLKIDILGAQRMGMTTVLRRPENNGEADPPADHVVADLRELLDLPGLSHLRATAPPPIPALIV